LQYSGLLFGSGQEFYKLENTRVRRDCGDKVSYYHRVIEYMNAIEFRVSVVIPTFNRSDVLDRAINSVLSQTCKVDEIIVVDDGSVDGTRELVSSWRHEKIVYIAQKNLGVSHARNAGIKRAKGNWIAFLDSDDEWHPVKLERQMTALVEQPCYELCHTNEIWIRDGRRVNAKNKYEKSGGRIFEKCLPLCVISPSTVLIKKSVFLRLGMFDEHLPACEDYDFWLRYCCNNAVLYLDEPMIKKYGGHADQLSKKFIGMDRYRLYAILKLLSSGVLTQNQARAAIIAFRKKIEIVIKGARKHQNQTLLNDCQLMQEQLAELIDSGQIFGYRTQGQVT